MDEKPDPNGCDLLLTWQSKNTQQTKQFCHTTRDGLAAGGGGGSSLNPPKGEGKNTLPPLKFLCNKKNRKAQKEEKSYTLLKTFVKFHLGSIFQSVR